MQNFFSGFNLVNNNIYKKERYKKMVVRLNSGNSIYSAVGNLKTKNSNSEKINVSLNSQNQLAFSANSENAVDIPNKDISMALRVKSLSLHPKIEKYSNHFLLKGINAKNVSCLSFCGSEKTKFDEQLDKMLAPDVVAIIGTSSSKFNTGSIVAANAIQENLNPERKIYLINPKGVKISENPEISLLETGKSYSYKNGEYKQEEQGNIKVVASIDEISERINAALVSIPEKSGSVAKALNNFKRHGTDGAYVVSNGFEGEENAAKMQEIKEIGKFDSSDNPMVILGVNGIGFYSNKTGNSPFNGTFFHEKAKFPAQYQKKGAVYILGSGALGQVAALLQEPTSIFVSSGNGATSSSKLIEHFAKDNNVGNVYAYVKDVAKEDKAELLEAAGEAGKIGKKITLLSGKKGNNYSNIKEDLSTAGINVIEDTTDLYPSITKVQDTKKIEINKEFLNHDNVRNVAIVSNSAGGGTFAAKKAESLGLNIIKMSDLEESTQNELKEKSGISREASIFTEPKAKFLDTVAEVDPKAYYKSIESMVNDRKVGSVVAYFLPLQQHLGTEKDFIVNLNRIQDTTKKPIIAVLATDVNSFTEAKAYSSRVPVVFTPEEAVTAIADATKKA